MVVAHEERRGLHDLGGRPGVAVDVGEFVLSIPLGPVEGHPPREEVGDVPVVVALDEVDLGNRLFEEVEKSGARPFVRDL